MKKYLPVGFYLIVYGWISFSFLTLFPFVHSDESWLAGLSRDMMTSGSFGVTEHFFDAKPRVAHALKLLYHQLQAAYISVFGFQISSVRLLSLTAALVGLFLVYLIGKHLAETWFSLVLTILVSLDIQVIYASHFARQEILLAVCMLACIRILLKSGGTPDNIQAALLGALTGIGIGLHPNGVLCISLCTCVMLLRFPDRTDISKKYQVQSLGVYLLVSALLTAVWIAISFSFTPNFISEYFRYGSEEFELGNSALGRIGEFISYFSRIYHQESGTYYLPDLRLELIGFLIATGIVSLAWLIMRKETEAMTWCKNSRVLLTSLLGLSLGMMVIGRFNQTGILFFVLLGWLVVGQALLLFELQGRRILILLLTGMVGLGSASQIQTQIRQSSGYEDYLEQLSQLVPSDAKVIGNLNMGFYFQQGALRDYRNLPYVESAQGLETYIADNQIEYILYMDELDYLWEHRPYYNGIYGSATFVDTLKTFCLQKCEPAGSFYHATYGTRIMSLLQDGEYGTVTVYRVP